jgi:hypothetical protein
MQFMYLRVKGKKHNKGRHPVGVIGVLKFEDCVQVAIATIHSEDRFVKEDGKDIVRAKMHEGNVVMIGTQSPVNLHAILPRGMGKRLDNYPRHQEIFELLVKDEMEQGTWSKQNRDYVNHVDEVMKKEINRILA